MKKVNLAVISLTTSVLFSGCVNLEYLSQSPKEVKLDEPKINPIVEKECKPIVETVYKEKIKEGIKPSYFFVKEYSQKVKANRAVKKYDGEFVGKYYKNYKVNKPKKKVYPLYRFEFDIESKIFSIDGGFENQIVKCNSLKGLTKKTFKHCSIKSDVSKHKLKYIYTPNEKYNFTLDIDGDSITSSSKIFSIEAFKFEDKSYTEQENVSSLKTRAVYLVAGVCKSKSDCPSKAKIIVNKK